MLATDNWCIKVQNRVYGPYTNEQMKAFAAEGRLSSQSLVTPAGADSWREARQYPPLKSIIDGRKETPRAFGKSGTEDKKGELVEGQESNIMVVFDVTAGIAGRVDNIVKQLGECFRVTDNVWMIRTTQSAIGVKNAIAPHIDVREPMVVVDCVRGRTSWQNFVPELHSRLTRLWVRM